MLRESWTEFEGKGVNGALKSAVNINYRLIRGIVLDFRGKACYGLLTSRPSKGKPGRPAKKVK
jgi:hypothetical protein